MKIFHNREKKKIFDNLCNKNCNLCQKCSAGVHFVYNRAEDGKTDHFLFFIPPYDERLRTQSAGVLSF